MLRNKGFPKSMEIYLEQISKYPVLCPEEEYELMHIYRTSENKKEKEKAYERLVNCNLKLVVHVAKKYSNPKIPLEDLIQEGNMGLLKALEKFDEKRGYKFSTYAEWWIKSSIIYFLKKNKYPIKVSIYAHNKLSQLRGKKEKAKFISRDREEIEKLEREIKNLRLPLYSIELKDYLKKPEDSKTNLPNQKVIKKEEAEAIEKALEILTEREREILNLYFGLNGNPPMVLKEVGKEFNITKQRVQQIKKEILWKLRNNSKARKLLNEFKN